MKQRQSHTPPAELPTHLVPDATQKAALHANWEVFHDVSHFEEPNGIFKRVKSIYGRM